MKKFSKVFAVVGFCCILAVGFCIAAFIKPAQKQAQASAGSYIPPVFDDEYDPNYCTREEFLNQTNTFHGANINFDTNY